VRPEIAHALRGFGRANQARGNHRFEHRQRDRDAGAFADAFQEFPACQWLSFHNH
jgi:hypothetical protein